MKFTLFKLLQYHHKKEKEKNKYPKATAKGMLMLRVSVLFHIVTDAHFWALEVQKAELWVLAGSQLSLINPVLYRIPIIFPILQRMPFTNLAL